MKYLAMFCFLAAASAGHGQSLVGTWQLTEEKTCFEAQMKESDTEKELTKDMGSSKTGVARVIKFNKNGTGEEGVFASGSRKGSDMTSFKYRISGKEIQILDKKSGLMTQQLVIDEFSQNTLRIHMASKDCETKAFSRIK